MNGCFDAARAEGKQSLELGMLRRHLGNHKPQPLQAEQRATPEEQDEERRFVAEWTPAATASRLALWAELAGFQMFNSGDDDADWPRLRAMIERKGWRHEDLNVAIARYKLQAWVAKGFLHSSVAEPQRAPEYQPT